MTVTKMGALLLIIYIDHETGVSDICFFMISAKKQIANRQQTQRILHNSGVSPKKSKCNSKRAGIYGWYAKKVGG